MGIFRSIACLCVIALTGATTHGQISLDLDVVPGDQGQRQQQHDDGHDAPPSPEEIRAMDKELRARIDKLPPHLKARANKVQDLHMKFVAGMAQDSPDTGKNGDIFFKNAIAFMKKLAADPRAKDDPAVHELIHFIANDFGEGDVPKGVPTLDLIKGEIEHMNAGLKDLRGDQGR